MRKIILTIFLLSLVLGQGMLLYGKDNGYNPFVGTFDGTTYNPLLVTGLPSDSNFYDAIEYNGEKYVSLEYYSPGPSPPMGSYYEVYKYNGASWDQITINYGAYCTSGPSNGFKFKVFGGNLYLVSSSSICTLNVGSFADSSLMPIAQAGFSYYPENFEVIDSTLLGAEALCGAFYNDVDSVTQVYCNTGSTTWDLVIQDPEIKYSIALTPYVGGFYLATSYCTNTGVYGCTYGQPEIFKVTSLSGYPIYGDLASISDTLGYAANVRSDFASNQQNSFFYPENFFDNDGELWALMMEDAATPIDGLGKYSGGWTSYSGTFPFGGSPNYPYLRGSFYSNGVLYTTYRQGNGPYDHELYSFDGSSWTDVTPAALSAAEQLYVEVLGSSSEPTITNFVINNDAEFTLSPDVSLDLTVNMDMVECFASNDDITFTSIGTTGLSGSFSKPWTLDAEGEKTVYVKCNNGTTDTSVISDSISYSTSPLINVFSAWDSMGQDGDASGVFGGFFNNQGDNQTVSDSGISPALDHEIWVSSSEYYTGDQFVGGTKKLSNGDYAVVWGDLYSSKLFTAVYDVFGTKISQHNVSVNQLTMSNPPMLAVNENGFAVFWHDYTGPTKLFTQLFSNTGENTTGVITVYENYDDHGIDISDQAYSPYMIAPLSNGFVVSWVENWYSAPDSYYKISARVIDDQGVLGNFIDVAYNNNGVGAEHGLVGLGDSFAVTWVQESNFLNSSIWSSSGDYLSSISNSSFVPKEKIKSVPLTTQGDYVIVWETPDTSTSLNAIVVSQGSADYVLVHETGMMIDKFDVATLQNDYFVVGWFYGSGEGYSKVFSGINEEISHSFGSYNSINYFTLEGLDTGGYVAAWTYYTDAPDYAYPVKGIISDEYWNLGSTFNLNSDTSSPKEKISIAGTYLGAVGSTDPTISSFKINDGNQSTLIENVYLNLTVNMEMAECFASNDDITFTSIGTVLSGSFSKPWDLGAEEGQKTVYVKCTNGTYYTPIKTDSITLIEGSPIKSLIVWQTGVNSIKGMFYDAFGQEYSVDSSGQNSAYGNEFLISTFGSSASFSMGDVKKLGDDGFAVLFMEEGALKTRYYNALGAGENIQTITTPGTLVNAFIVPFETGEYSVVWVEDAGPNYNYNLQSFNKTSSIGPVNSFSSDTTDNFVIPSNDFFTVIKIYPFGGNYNFSAQNYYFNGTNYDYAPNIAQIEAPYPTENAVAIPLVDSNGFVIGRILDEGWIKLYLFDEKAGLIDEVFVNKGNSDPISNLVLTPLSDGGFAVSWQGDYKVFTRTFDSGGRPLSEIKELYDTLSTSIWINELTADALPEEKYVVSWKTYETSLSTDIFSEVLLSDGTTIQDDIVVKEYRNNLSELSTFGLSTGGFGVAYLDPNPSPNIYSSFFDNSYSLLSDSQVSSDNDVPHNYPYSTSIYFERTEELPQVLSFKINDGDEYVVSEEVSLGLYLNKKYLNCYASNDNTTFISLGQNTEAGWNYFDWTLTSGEGEKTVYVNCTNGTHYSINTDNITLLSSSPIKSMITWDTYGEQVKGMFYDENNNEFTVPSSGEGAYGNEVLVSTGNLSETNYGEGDLKRLGDGGFAVLWTNSGQLQTRSYDAFGKANPINQVYSGNLGNSFIIPSTGEDYAVVFADSNTASFINYNSSFNEGVVPTEITTSFVDAKSISGFNSYDSFFVTWVQSDTNEKVFAKEFGFDGTAKSSSIELLQFEESHSNVNYVVAPLVDSNGFVVGRIFEDTGIDKIKLRFFGEGGSFIKEEIISYGTNPITGLLLTPLTTGGVAVSWKEDSRVFTKTFTSSGTSVSSEVQVYDAGSDFVTEFVSDTLPSGNYFVSWGVFGGSNTELLSSVISSDATIINGDLLTAESADLTEAKAFGLDTSGFGVTYLNSSRVYAGLFDPGYSRTTLPISQEMDIPNDYQLSEGMFVERFSSNPLIYSFEINNGKQYTKPLNIKLYLSVNAVMSECFASNDNNTYTSIGTNFGPGSFTADWTLPSGEGEKTVYVKCTNGTYYTPIKSDNITHLLNSPLKYLVAWELNDGADDYLWGLFFNSTGDNVTVSTSSNGNIFPIYNTPGTSNSLKPFTGNDVGDLERLSDEGFAVLWASTESEQTSLMTKTYDLFGEEGPVNEVFSEDVWSASIVPFENTAEEEYAVVWSNYYVDSLNVSFKIFNSTTNITDDIVISNNALTKGLNSIPSKDGFFVTWLEEVEEFDWDKAENVNMSYAYVQKFDYNGNNLTDKIKIGSIGLNTSELSGDKKPYVVAPITTSNGFVLARIFENEDYTYEVKAKFFTHLGETIGDWVVIQDRAPEYLDNLSLTELTDWGVAFSWGGDEVYSKVYDHAGRNISSKLILTNSVSPNEVISAPLIDGDYVVAWVKTDGNLEFRKVTSTFQGEEIPLIWSLGPNGYVSNGFTNQKVSVSGWDDGSFAFAYAFPPVFTKMFYSNSNILKDETDIDYGDYALAEGMFTERNESGPLIYSFEINNGKRFTKPREVNLNISVNMLMNECFASNDGNTFESIGNNLGPGYFVKSWDVTNGEGNKTVYVKCNNVANTSVFTDNITQLNNTPINHFVSWQGWIPAQYSILGLFYNTTNVLYDGFKQFNVINSGENGASGNVSAVSTRDFVDEVFETTSNGTISDVKRLYGDGFALIWQKNGSTLMTRAYDLFGEPDSNGKEVTSLSGFVNTSLIIPFNQEGEYAVVWTEDNNMFFSLFNQTHKMKSKTLVTTNVESTQVFGIPLQNSFVLSWLKEPIIGQFELYVQEFDYDGNSLTIPKLILSDTTNFEYKLSQLIDSDGFVVSRVKTNLYGASETYDLELYFFDNSLNKINQNPVLANEDNAEDILYTELTPLSTGGIAVNWKEDFRVLTRVFDSSGKNVSEGVIEVFDGVNNYPTELSSSSMKDGKYLLSWVVMEGASDYKIYSSVYSNTGEDLIASSPFTVYQGTVLPSKHSSSVSDSGSIQIVYEKESNSYAVNLIYESDSLNFVDPEFQLSENDGSYPFTVGDFLERDFVDLLLYYVKINNGERYTYGKIATIDILANTNMTSCSISNDNVSFTVRPTNSDSNPSAYINSSSYSTPWVLTDGEGEKTVYVKCTNGTHYTPVQTAKITRMYSSPISYFVAEDVSEYNPDSVMGMFYDENGEEFNVLDSGKYWAEFNEFVVSNTSQNSYLNSGTYWGDGEVRRLNNDYFAVIWNQDNADGTYSLMTKVYDMFGEPSGSQEVWKWSTANPQNKYSFIIPMMGGNIPSASEYAVVWANVSSGIPEIYYQVFASEPFMNITAPTLVTNSIFMANDPINYPVTRIPVAYGAPLMNSFLVSWLEYDPNTDTQYHLGSVIKWDGSQFLFNGTIDTLTSASTYNTIDYKVSPLVDSYGFVTGRLTEDASNNWALDLKFISNNWTVAEDWFAVNQTFSEPIIDFKLTSLKEGGVAVTWKTDHKVYTRIYDSYGIPLSNVVEVYDAGTYSVTEFDSSAMTNNNYSVSWMVVNSTHYEIFDSVISEDGVILEQNSSVYVNTVQPSDHSVSGLSTGGMGFAYSASSLVYQNIFDSNYISLHESFVVEATGGHPLAAGLFDYNPDPAVLFNINSGKAYTNNPAVTLYLEVNNFMTNCSAKNNFTDPWTQILTSINRGNHSVTWNIESAEDGQKQVWVMCTQVNADTGEVIDTETFTQTITLDTTPPHFVSWEPLETAEDLEAPFTFTVNLDDNADNCRWSLRDIPHASMQMFDSGFGSAQHKTRLIYNETGQATYYVSCTDAAGNQEKRSFTFDITKTVYTPINYLVGWNSRAQIKSVDVFGSFWDYYYNIYTFASASGNHLKTNAYETLLSYENDNNEATIGPDSGDVIRLVGKEMVTVWKSDTAPLTLGFKLIDADGNIVVNKHILTNETATISDVHVKALAGGGFVVVWKGSVNAEERLLAQVFDNQGNALTNLITLASGIDFYTNFDVSVSPLGSGGFVTVWNHQTADYLNHLEQRVFNETFGVISSSTLDGSILYGAFDSPKVEFNGDSFTVSYHNATSNELVASSFDAFGQFFNEVSFDVSPGLNEYDLCSLDGGGVALVWDLTGSTNILTNVINITGELVSTPQTVRSWGYPLTDMGLKCTGLVEGGYVVAWEEFPQTPVITNTIFGRVYNTTASPISDLEILSDITTFDKLSFDLEPLDNGGFVVAWDLDVSPSVDNHTYTRVFNTNGYGVRGTVNVNFFESTAAPPNTPRVAGTSLLEAAKSPIPVPTINTTMGVINVPQAWVNISVFAETGSFDGCSIYYQDTEEVAGEELLTFNNENEEQQFNIVKDLNLTFHNRDSLTGSADWWDSSWTQRNNITFDQANTLGSSLSSFPVLVKLTPANFDYASAKADGSDLRFLDSDDATELAFEVEKWVQNGDSFIWVNVPTLDDTGTDFIYVYYGNSGASSTENPTGVWGSNYLMVQHMNEASGSILDSTGNYNCVGYGSNTYGALGQVGAGITMGGGASIYNSGKNPANTDVFDCGNFVSPTSFTTNFWVKGPCTDADGILSDFRHDLSQNSLENGFIIAVGYDTSIHAGMKTYVQGDTNRQSTVYSTTNVCDNNWHMVTNTFTSGVGKIYVDGNFEDSDPGEYLDIVGEPLYIGNGYSINGYAGTIDEVSIMNTAVSDAWVTASYLSMSNTLLSVGSEEVYEAPVVGYMYNFTLDYLNGTTSYFELTEGNPARIGDYIFELNSTTGGDLPINVSVNYNGSNVTLNHWMDIYPDTHLTQTTDEFNYGFNTTFTSADGLENNHNYTFSVNCSNGVYASELITSEQWFYVDVATPEPKLRLIILEGNNPFTRSTDVELEFNISDTTSIDTCSVKNSHDTVWSDAGFSGTSLWNYSDVFSNYWDLNKTGESIEEGETVRVGFKCNDTFGEILTAEEASVIWDNNAPNIYELKATDVQKTSATISWSSIDSYPYAGNVSYVIEPYLPSEFSEVEATEFELDNFTVDLIELEENKSYYYRAKVWDEAGNEAAGSGYFNTSGISVALQSPTTDKLVDQEITFSVYVNDPNPDVNNVTVVYALPGQPQTSELLSGTYPGDGTYTSSSINVGTTPGTLNFYFIVKDEDGNEVRSPPTIEEYHNIGVTVTAPEVTISNPIGVVDYSPVQIILNATTEAPFNITNCNISYREELGGAFVLWKQVSAGEGVRDFDYADSFAIPEMLNGHNYSFSAKCANEYATSDLENSTGFFKVDITIPTPKLEIDVIEGAGAYSRIELVNLNFNVTDYQLFDDCWVKNYHDSSWQDAQLPDASEWTYHNWGLNQVGYSSEQGDLVRVSFNCTDGFGETKLAEEASVIWDNNAPDFVGLNVPSVLSDSATVEWDDVGGSNVGFGWVGYGLTTELGTNTTAQLYGSVGVGYEVTMSPLVQGSDYFYQAYSNDTAGNVNASTVNTLETRAAPTVSNVQPTNDVLINTEVTFSALVTDQEPNNINNVTVVYALPGQPQTSELFSGSYPDSGTYTSSSINVGSNGGTLNFYFIVKDDDGNIIRSPVTEGTYHSINVIESKPIVTLTYPSEVTSTLVTIILNATTEEPGTLTNCDLYYSEDSGELVSWGDTSAEVGASELNWADSFTTPGMKNGVTYEFFANCSNEYSTSDLVSGGTFVTNIPTPEPVLEIQVINGTQGYSNSEYVNLTFDVGNATLVDSCWVKNLGFDWVDAGFTGTETWDYINWDLNKAGTSSEQGDTVVIQLNCTDEYGDIYLAQQVDVVWDNNAPSFTDIFATPGYDSAEVEWSTLTDDDGWVEWGNETGNYLDNTTVLLASSGYHDHTISNLEEKTEYFYRVWSTDPALNTNVSQEYSFTTGAIPVRITSGPFVDVKSTSATVTWVTNIAATSEVNYGLDSENLDQISFNYDLKQSHSLVIPELAPGQTYFYKVYSEAETDNNVSTEVMSFLTYQVPQENDDFKYRDCGGGSLVPESQSIVIEAKATGSTISFCHLTDTLVNLKITAEGTMLLNNEKQGIALVVDPALEPFNATIKWVGLNQITGIDNLTIVHQKRGVDLSVWDGGFTSFNVLGEDLESEPVFENGNLTISVNKFSSWGAGPLGNAPELPTVEVFTYVESAPVFDLISIWIFLSLALIVFVVKSKKEVTK